MPDAVEPAAAAAEGFQLGLPMAGTEEGATRCGYCGRRLVRQEAGDWACPRCAPLLRVLGAGLDFDAPGGWSRWVSLFAQFLREAHRDRVA